MILLAELQEVANEAAERRTPAGEALVDDAERLTRACYDMAVRFHRGGRLLAFGNGNAGTDANHIAVEFVHPVIVGKRALPALALTNDVATVTGVANRDGFAEVFAHQLRCWASSADIALGLSPDGKCGNVLRGLQTAQHLGLLTVALTGGNSDNAEHVTRRVELDHALVARTTDPQVAAEVHTTVYHILWELVHVFFEQPGWESEVAQ